jgi:hypothetical protein
MIQPHDRLCVLADSLPGAIRWRYSDYEQLLRKQLQILAPPLRLVWHRGEGAREELPNGSTARPQ